MDTTPGPGPEPVTCRIRVKGHLGTRWEPWFDDLTITAEANGDTLISGGLADQSALHGLLRKIRDLGLPLVSVTCEESSQAMQEPSPMTRDAGKDPFL